MTSTQLFAAGHGLSYSTVVYRPLRSESDAVDAPLDRDGWRVAATGTPGPVTMSLAHSLQVRRAIECGYY